MAKSPEMQAFLNKMTATVFGVSLGECQAKGICVTCGAGGEDGKTAVPYLTFRDEISAKEYGISGMCQSCQDSVFGENS